NPVIDVLLQPIEADHLLHAAGHEQVIDHVEDQQSLHRIIREALARLGEAEEAQPLWMTEEGAVVVSPLLKVGSGFGDRHRSTSLVIAAGPSFCTSFGCRTRLSAGPKRSTRI